MTRMEANCSAVRGVVLQRGSPAGSVAFLQTGKTGQSQRTIAVQLDYCRVLQSIFFLLKGFSQIANVILIVELVLGVVLLLSLRVLLNPHERKVLAVNLCTHAL